MQKKFLNLDLLYYEQDLYLILLFLNNSGKKLQLLEGINTNNNIHKYTVYCDEINDKQKLLEVRHFYD